MLEIVICIGIFAIISVFLLQMFLSSNALQEKSEDVGKSILKAENMAETIKAADNIEQAIDQLQLEQAFIAMDEKEDTYTLKGVFQKKAEGTKEGYISYYDKNWKMSKENKKAKYCVVMLENQAEKGLQEVNLFFFHLGGYSLLEGGKKNILLYYLHTSDYKK